MYQQSELDYLISTMTRWRMLTSFYDSNPEAYLKSVTEYKPLG